jgi:hypothetical protein
MFNPPIGIGIYDVTGLNFSSRIQTARVSVDHLLFLFKNPLIIFITPFSVFGVLIYMMPCWPCDPMALSPSDVRWQPQLRPNNRHQPSHRRCRRWRPAPAPICPLLSPFLLRFLALTHSCCLPGKVALGSWHHDWTKIIFSRKIIFFKEKV